MDPAFRTGCKLAVVDPTGKVLDTTVIYPTAPQNKVAEAKAVLKKLIAKYHITLISPETERHHGNPNRSCGPVKGTSGKKYSTLLSMRRARQSILASKLATEEF